MEQIYDSYSKFRIFERFVAIQFDLKFENSQLYKGNIARIFSFMSSALKSVPGDLLLSDLTMKKLQLPNYSSHILCLDKLAGNMVPARHLDTVQYSNRIWNHWIRFYIQFVFESSTIFDSIQMKFQIPYYRLKLTTDSLLKTATFVSNLEQDEWECQWIDKYCIPCWYLDRYNYICVCRWYLVCVWQVCL